MQVPLRTLRVWDRFPMSYSLRTACRRFVRQHTSKLHMAGTGHALAELFRHSSIVVLTEMNLHILRHQPPRQLMVSILPSIAYSLLEARREFRVVAALRLRQTPLGLLEFPRMLDHLSLRGGQQVLKSRVDADHAISHPLNLLRLRIYEQAQIPARGALPHAPALDSSLRQLHAL